MRWPRTGAVLVLLGSTVGAAGCAQEQSSDPASTAPPVVSSVPIGDEATPAPTGSQGLVVQVPDHVRYGPDGVVVMRAGVETTLADQPVEWASSDGTGGVVYSIDGQVWWRPTESDDVVPIDADGLFARSVGGRPTLIARTTERCSGDGEFSWLVVHDLSSGEEQRVACVGWGGDATIGMSDVGDGRYVVRWEMDLANYSTAQGLAVGGFGGGDAGDPAGPLWNGLNLAGNPYPDAETCRVLREGEPTAACDVHGRLSPDALLLATWYRPDFSIVVDPTGIPPEVVADEAGWLARLDTLPAEVTVHELDTGIERYRTELPARTRLADYDGRFLVTAPHCQGTAPDTCDDSAGTWTIIDTNGQQPPLILAGPLALLRPQVIDAPWVEVDAPRLERGDTGPWVSFLQQRLQRFGAAIAVDGIFGPATDAAVRDFQTARRLAVDGLVGSKTWAALTGAAEAEPVTPSTTASDPATTTRPSTTTSTTEVLDPGVAAMEVTMTPTGSDYDLGPVHVEFVLISTGTAPLLAVTLNEGSVGYRREGLCDRVPIEGPFVEVGNTDYVLDPGETWSYGCDGKNNHGGPDYFVEVTATTPTGEPITVRDEARHPVRFERPFTTTLTPSATTVAHGEVVEWTIDVTNVADFVLLPLRRVRAAIDPPGVEYPTVFDTLGPPIADGDGDGSFEPGETWTWTYAAPIMSDGSRLVGSVDFIRHPPNGPTSGYQFESDPIAVQPSRPPDAPLPTSPATNPSL